LLNCRQLRKSRLKEVLREAGGVAQVVECWPSIAKKKYKNLKKTLRGEVLCFLLCEKK
jgi:hypothetical protein